MKKVTCFLDFRVSSTAQESAQGEEREGEYNNFRISCTILLLVSSISWLVGCAACCYSTNICHYALIYKKFKKLFLTIFFLGILLIWYQ